MDQQLDIPYTLDDPLDKIVEELRRCDMPYGEKQKIVDLILQEKNIKLALNGNITKLQFRLEEANKRLLESTIAAQSGYFEYLTGGTEAENKAAEKKLQTICQCSPKLIVQVITELQRQRIMPKNLGALTVFVKQFNRHFSAQLKYDSFHAAYQA